MESLGNPGIYDDHKIGGQPFFSQLEGEIREVLNLLRDGHVHLLQLTMPSIVTEALMEALMDGTWPFGEAVFHVFAKKSGSEFEFHYIWA